jgi:hypothetical protein
MVEYSKGASHITFRQDGGGDKCETDLSKAHLA